MKPATPAPQAVASDHAGSADRAGGDPIPGLFQRAGAALQQDSPEAALAYFREAAAARPNNPQILLSAATMALRYNHPDVAVELLAPAERRFADSAALRRILGVAYYRLGDYRSSQVALQQALSLDKSSALSYFLVGCTLAKLGQFESAETHFRQAQTIDPRYAVRR
jgi:tetratricopeptide (TPR) repeat protein